MLNQDCGGAAQLIGTTEALVQERVDQRKSFGNVLIEQFHFEGTAAGGIEAA